MREACSKSFGNPSLRSSFNQVDARVFLGEREDDLSGTVGRGVVNHEDFEPEGGWVGGE